MDRSKSSKLHPEGVREKSQFFHYFFNTVPHDIDWLGLVMLRYCCGILVLQKTPPYDLIHVFKMATMLVGFEFRKLEEVSWWVRGGVSKFKATVDCFSYWNLKSVNGHDILEKDHTCSHLASVFWLDCFLQLS